MSYSPEPLDITALPSNILDTLVPGYSLISRYIETTFGVDISLFVSVAVLTLALIKGGQYFYTKFSSVWRYSFLSSVYIDEHDDLFDMLMDWLAATHTSSSRRSVRARTQRRSHELEGPADDALDSDGMFDYNRWSAGTPPRYEPYYGRHFLWQNGRLFLLHRSHKTTVGQSLQVRFGNFSEDDIIQLDCIGRSVEPIRDLLRTVKVWSLQRHRNTTTIRHPTPKDHARFSGSWSKTFSRPSRPMETVILDTEQKNMIVKDMNDYLHPSSPKWYALRGIPYRRGYLFHGPPGTGKTSFSFALAGIFGLGTDSRFRLALVQLIVPSVPHGETHADSGAEIYVISLQEPTLTEGDLIQLFNGLPKRCIVLLEDVDAAGLIRDRGNDDETKEAQSKWRKAEGQSKDTSKHPKDGQPGQADQKPNKDADYTLKDLARELKATDGPRGGSDRSQGNTTRLTGPGISLSGLLNAIDGVASHEGRVLIMTTNQPEKLDAALVRPGRVDRRVQFAKAKKLQIQELFFRMYVSSPEQASSEPKAIDSVVRPQDEGSNGHINKMPNGHVLGGDLLKAKTAQHTSTLRKFAAEFADHVPDDTFTPAEIQNHLMQCKDEPEEALAKVDEWMKEIRAERQEQDQPDDIVDH